MKSLRSRAHQRHKGFRAEGTTTGAELVALVTGGSRGIGAAIARRLAADGFAVLIKYRVDAQAADAVVAAIRARGGRAASVRADVGDPEQVRDLFDAALEHFGRTDRLVSNAGVGHSAPIARTALGRLGEPEDIADVVAFLASHEARWITGQAIAVYGGLT